MTNHALALTGVPVLFPKGLNVSAYLDINRFARQTAWAHGFMSAYALWAGLVLLTLVFVCAYALVWWRRDVRGAALLFMGGAGTLVALGLNQLVGHAAQELRPYDTLHHVLVLVARANDYAFPSDHAVVAGGLVTSLLLVIRQAKIIATDATRGGSISRRRFTPPMAWLTVVAVVLGLFLCFARVYVGAHYPGDVVAGLLFGAGVVLVVSLLRPVAYVVARLLVHTPLSVLLRRPGM